MIDRSYMGKFPVSELVTSVNADKHQHAHTYASEYSGEEELHFKKLEARAATQTHPPHSASSFGQDKRH